MDTTKVNVTSLFGLDVQYRIPLFQRHYVWDQENQWEPLWDDLKEKSSRRIAASWPTHFTGAIVTQQQMTPAGNVQKYEIIDGQQRLTTFQIILCAIRNICKLEGQNDVASDAHRFIRNQGTQLRQDEKYKLIPTAVDKDSFISLVDECESESEGRIRSAYDYFKGEIADYVKGDREKVLSLLRSLLNDFGFVQILIDDSDEPERIFESLNARGKSLLQFDLLRNNLFLRAGEYRDAWYEKYWAHFEDAYWDPEEKSGTSCEHFLQHFLMAKLGREDVKPEFDTYQRRYCRGLKASHNIEHEFSELKRYSEIYTKMTDCVDSSEIGRRLKFYQTFNLTTLHPFILFVICEAKISGDELTRVFDILESYTLRRMLCCGGRRGLLKFNIFFSQAIKELGDDFNLEKFIKLLSQQCSDTHKYPDNDEIPPALHAHYEEHSVLFPDDSTIIFPNNRTVRAALQGLWGNTAGTIRKRLIRYVLYRIERMKHNEDGYREPIVFGDDLTLEHVLPQAWKEKWDLPIAEESITYDGTGSGPKISVNRELGADSLLYADLFTDLYKKKNTDWQTKPSREGLTEASYLDAFNLALARDHCLESIGNLTLITRRLNSKL
ncbi:hypothetical protein C6500_07520 [Candidatus Poribacteria bacterium]|nr:MAG: hypothetical protein C6500_07520 [Candidatus Poribacteria bacterium]